MSLTEAQRDREIQGALFQLAKLGNAAVGQQRAGNATGYESIQRQIVQVGKHLKEVGGIPLMDATYRRLENQASSPAVREVTLAWSGFGGVDGWYM